jgi:fatty acid desaturase
MEDARNLIGRDALAALQRKSDLRGAWAVLFNWALVAIGFALAILWPNPLGVIAALIVLGGRQLGLGILMHDAAHRSLFANAKANDWVGQWLCAAPMFADLNVYRRYHMTHHREAGSERDPDLPNYRGYPVGRASFARKLLRDIVGLTGLKAAAGLLMMYTHERPQELLLGYSYRHEAGRAQAEQAAEANPRSALAAMRNLWRIAVLQALMAAVPWSLGHAMAYLLWPAAWLTSYMLFSRIRNAAEHGGLPGTLSTDLWNNTRSVRAAWWERLTVAPNHVNWHFEHHLAPTVPGYRLRTLHRVLASAQLPGKLPTRASYIAVIRELVTDRPATSTVP